MRKALNENPKVQAGVIALLLVGGVLLFMKMSKSADTGATGATTDPAAANAATATGGAGAVSADGVVPTAATGATAAAPVTPTAAPIAPTAAGGTVSPEALVPGRDPDIPRKLHQENGWVRLPHPVSSVVGGGIVDQDRLCRDGGVPIDRGEAPLELRPHGVRNDDDADLNLGHALMPGTDIG